MADGAAGQQCIAYPGSIGRFHYGEEGEKGFLMWEVGPDGARCTLEPTPARRTLDIVFEGKPDLDEASAKSDVDDEQCEDRLVVHPVGAEECNHSH